MNNQKLHFDKVRIRSTGSYVPEFVLSNEAVTQNLATKPEWISENLGVSERRIAASDEYTSDIAAKAGLAAIQNAGLDKNDIDMVILATSTPDRKSPATACSVQAKIGITNHCPVFDVAAVCSGFLYGMTIAANFIQTGSCKRVLVIGADTFSKITDWGHRNCVFFGDGAGAVVMDRNEQADGLFASHLYADGSGLDNFTIYPQDSTFTMNGRAVYDTATAVLPRAIRDLLALHKLTLEDVSAIIPHQPSIRVLKKTAEELDVPFSLIHTNLDKHANTAGATVPLLLDQVNQKNLLKPGDLVVFAAVGGGWTWGAALYRWC